jgi:catechol 2,3-dioxygenase-like lactoylglutathione lyase family enzyme
MLSNYPVHTTIPASDMDRACAFYGDKLGFELLYRIDAGAMFRAAEGTRFSVYPTPNAGQAPSTYMGFQVDDVEKVVADLRDRGVTFEEYDSPHLKTDNGVATMGDVKGAWFKDTEGNILGMVHLPE